jgi:tetratricopeptide repeat protein
MSLNCLAVLLHDHGDLAAARPLIERALAISEKALGPDHPHTNRTRCHLARLLIASGHASEALGPAETALRAHEKVLGPNHRWTKNTARVTAEALDALGRADQAAALRARYGVERDRENQ